MNWGCATCECRRGYRAGYRLGSDQLLDLLKGRAVRWRPRIRGIRPHEQVSGEKLDIPLPSSSVASLPLEFTLRMELKRHGQLCQQTEWLTSREERFKFLKGCVSCVRVGGRRQKWHPSHLASPHLECALGIVRTFGVF